MDKNRIGKFLFFLALLLILSSPLWGCKEAQAVEDNKRFMKEFMKMSRYYGLSPMFPVVEDVYVGDVFIVSPEIKSQNKYTLVFVNSLLDRTNPYTQDISNCLLMEFKKYQFARPIVEKRIEGTIPDAVTEHTRVRDPEYNINISLSPNSNSKSSSSSNSNSNSKSSSTSTEASSATNASDKKIQCEPCWQCCKNDCPYLFEAKEVGFPSIEIGRSKFDKLSSFIPFKLLMFLFTFEWNRSRYKIYHFPDVELVSFPYNKFKNLLPQNIDNESFLTLTGGLTPTEIVNICCNMDGYCETNACKAIKSTRKKSECNSYEYLDVSFRIPYLIYYTKSVVIEDTKRRSMGFTGKINVSSSGTEVSSTENTRNYKDSVALIRNFNAPVAIASKNLKYTFIFRNSYPDKFNQWDLVGLKEKCN